MTEVGAVMQTTSAANADSTIILEASSNGELLSDQQNGTATNKIVTEIMEVDGTEEEEEEDDSQITTSTENGRGGDDNKLPATDAATDVRKSMALSNSTENRKVRNEAEAEIPTKPLATTASLEEDSTTACDEDAPIQHGIHNDKISEERESHDDSGKATCMSNSHQHPKNKATATSEPNSEASNHAAEVDSDAETEPTNNNLDATSKESAKVIKGTDISTTAAPVEGVVKEAKKGITNLSRDTSAVESPIVPEENGTGSDCEIMETDGDGIVDLDDSDEEGSESVPNKDPLHIESANGAEPNLVVPPASAAPSNQRQPGGCDSDGAFIIGSDSENEAAISTPSSNATPAEHSPPHLASRRSTENEDDDDCVVIEDDGPAPEQPKRKNLAMDATSNSDDSQPPSKKHRSTPQPQPPPLSVSQLTIKDPRSLMPQEMLSKKIVPDTSIYPVNITPAASVSPPGPPKLVPVSNVTNLPLTGVPGMSTNANLLPGLTDDMFVLEAPSFIVPYIYEKPPSVNLKDILKELETKYKLTKEDLENADNPDEFDMMTEQNKEDREEKIAKKKKKRPTGDEGDESWSEESDEDEDEDDDDDSESGMRTKVLIKEASDDLTVLKGAIKPAVAVTTSTTAANLPIKPGLENYFESPLGKFFMDIGVGLVQEYVQTDLIRLQKRKMRKSLGKNITDFERAISALSGNLEASKRKNASFKFTMKRCEFCNFRSESALAMANHYETPHMNGVLYKCNFCIFEIRNCSEIVYHMEAVHNIKARLIKPLPYHQCPNCGFEDNGKAKLARHQPVCAKKFRPELNLAPPNDWEAPAKIPRIKPRHGLVGTATAYQAMAAQAAAQRAALASIQQQQQQVTQARSIQAATIAAQNAANKIRGRPPIVTKPGPNGGGVFRGPNLVRSPMATNVVMPNNYQMSGAQFIPQNANAMAKKTLSGQPSISITPLPRQSAAAPVPTTSAPKLPPAGMKPGQNPAAGNKAQFVICEICDGYIKDLDQLRNHMQWMHKVKIHPKMIYNRPPLNCQKCQFRFFTDQGLERHLLGSHGLVTSSMQEAANKGKDSGRCPVCGRMYQWKLLNHVSRDHHMTLKPAHLSYKCTVCTATFGMYKQFETHVYTAHSTVAKKAMDGKKNNGPQGGPGGASGSSLMHRNSNNMGTSNDSLLKPLKINDEITIIPQPASKPRMNTMESHIID